MSQESSILTVVAGPLRTPESAELRARYAGQKAASNGLGRIGELDTPAPAPEAVCVPGSTRAGGRVAAGSLSLPITANRSEDHEEPEPDIEARAARCPSMASRAFLNLDTGQIVPARCSRLRCSYCVRVNARRRAMAISASVPRRAVLLTQVGNDWQTVRMRVGRLRYEVAREVGPFQWVWHVEPNPAGTGHHVHAWQHGPFMPQKLLASKASWVGMGGFARVNEIRSRVGASAYGLKGLSYGLKGAAAEDEGLGYLVDNGWRLTHQSRKFFRVGDVPVRVKDAERSALGLTEGGEGRWVLVPVGP